MLEIILIILAWKKGWGWKAILPSLVTWAIAFMLAAFLGEGAFVIVMALAVFELIILGKMASRKPDPSIQSHTVISESDDHITATEES